MHKNHYLRLLVMTVLSFLAMYVLMYAMVDSFSNVFSNCNQFYMAGLMAAPMVLIELLLMGAMYPNKKWNALIATASVAAAITFWVCIRQQVGIADKQFLKSMIPHQVEGGALSVRHSSYDDPERRKPMLAQHQSGITDYVCGTKE